MTKFTDKQIQALKKFKNKSKVYFLHYGGSRSGKTLLDSEIIINRALDHENTRHLVCRASKASCVASIWMQTLIPLLEKYYYKDRNGNIIWEEDKTKKIIYFANGSSIWAGGFDNVQHKDELLAKEWATILIEEATELGYVNFIKLLTRLNWNPETSNIALKMILECNPTTLSHWLNQYFFKYIDYETRQPLTTKEISEIEKTHFSPEDNKVNLSIQLLEKLRNLKGMARKRFYKGIFADSFEGQIYEFNRETNLVENKIEYDPNILLYRTWDFGISPSKTFIIWIQLKIVPKSEEFPEGFRIDIIDEYDNDEMDYKHYSNICKEKEYNNDNVEDIGDPAGHSRNESLQSWISMLASEGIYIKTPKGNPSIDDYISNANRYMPYVRLHENTTPKMVEMFENWGKPKDKDGRVLIGSKPEHNEFSHPGTAWYYWVMWKFPFKKSGIYLP